MLTLYARKGGWRCQNSCSSEEEKRRNSRLWMAELTSTSGEAIVEASRSKKDWRWWSEEVVDEWLRGVFVWERGEVRKTIER